MKRKWLFGFVVATLVVGIILAGCAPTPEAPPEVTPPEVTPPEVTPPEVTPPAEEEAIILPWGICACLSGPYAPWGLSEFRAQTMEVDDINEGGGCWGAVHGHEPGFRVKGQLYNWEITGYDYKLDSTESIKVINRLIYKDNCKFIHIFVGECLYPNRDVLTENKIFITEQGFGPEILGPEYPRTFETLQQPGSCAIAITPWMYEQGYHKVAIFAEKSTCITYFIPAYVPQMENVGMELLTTEVYEVGLTDFVPYLTKIIALNPELIWGHMPAADMGIYVKQARELGYTGDIMFWGPWTWKELAETTGDPELMEGLYCSNMIAECTLPRQEWLRDEYTQRYGEAEWCTSIVDRADPLYILTAAIERANSLDTDEVAKAMETLPEEKIKSFYGDPAWFGGKTDYGIDHALVTPIHIVKIVNGKQIDEAIVIQEKGAW